MAVVTTSGIASANQCNYSQRWY